MSEEVVLTPMMKQFFELKTKHPDAVMLFRCGDFYETYCEDAVAASEILGITLTKRNNGKGGQTIEMAGFPHHALDTYLPKLIRAGRRVAICDQLEDPKLTKKLVKRGITELVTPGVSINDTILNYKENNFLAAVHFGKNTCGVAFLDISTGEFLTAEGTNNYIDKLLNNFAPKEVLFERGRRSVFEEAFGNRFFTFELDDWAFAETTAREKLLRHFEVKNLKGFGVEHLRLGVVAAGAILQYLQLTQHTQIGHITAISRIEEDKYVRLDKFTVRSLELIGTMNEGGNSLLNVIDRTISPMGARLLKRWLLFPLKDASPIRYRQDVVEYFFRQPEFKEEIEEQLKLIGDLERILSKAAVGRVSPREVATLKVALQAIEPIKAACMQADNGSLNTIGEQLNPCIGIRQRIEKEIAPDPPLMVNKGGVIREGVNEELDELRRIAYSGKDYLLKLQQRESDLTGIPSLKIGYNNVFGYYIEVRNTHKDKVPAEWIRKQTLANAERYITQELKDKAEYCSDSGMLVGEACKKDPRGERTEVGYFVKGSEPTEKCKTHVLVRYDSVEKCIASNECKNEDIILVGMLNIKRSFPVQIYVTDAQYVWRDIGKEVMPETANGLPFFNNLLAKNEYAGISNTETQFNSYCRKHFNYQKWKERE